MPRRFWWLLSIAMLFFVASAAGVMLALDRGSAWLARLAFAGMAVSAGFFLAAAFLPSRRVDWNRIEAEQRLWESGPLGRSWLRIRQRLAKLWKL